MENFDLMTVISVIITGVATFLGVFWAKFKGKFGKIVKLVKEFYELAETMEKALDDDKIDKKEIIAIKDKFNSLKLTFKELFGNKDSGK